MNYSISRDKSVNSVRGTITFRPYTHISRTAHTPTLLRITYYLYASRAHWCGARRRNLYRARLSERDTIRIVTHWCRGTMVWVPVSRTGAINDPRPFRNTVVAVSRTIYFARRFCRNNAKSRAFGKSFMRHVTRHERLIIHRLSYNRFSYLSIYFFVRPLYATIERSRQSTE